MTRRQPTRREFLKGAAGLAASLYAVPRTTAGKPRARNDRLRIGSIGMRYQGSVIAEKAQAYGDIVAICDVDREIAEKARAQFGGKADLYEDYRDLLQREDVDVVTIGAPDHWHARMLIDACRAGKDVYCEKPLTLTVDEGRHILKAVDESGRVVQVGTWQRSDHRFRLACEMVRSGRIGAPRKVAIVLGKNVTGGPFATAPVPPHLNWDLWQGQTPAVAYVPERCHYTFRWWAEYSGGQMTDWGAHHIDIAQWAIGMEHSGPVEIEGKARYPNIENGYNVPADFEARFTYSNDVVMTVSDTGRNGILFEGTGGRIFVNRGSLEGTPVEDLERHPLPREEFRLYSDDMDRPPRMGKLDAILNHMGNFYDCVLSRRTPVSDVVSQHRSVSVCHLANISMRLGRPLHWDPEREQAIDDPEANAMLRREQRKGFEVG